MPHFDGNGEGTWLCQGCTKVFPDSAPSLQALDFGTVCQDCAETILRATAERLTANPNVLTHNGTFTVKSLRTGEHRTFNVKTQPREATFAPGKRVVALLSGPDNTSDYTGFAFVEGGTVKVWSRHRGTLYERYAKMLLRLEEYIRDGDVEVYAATRCRVCNRVLTTPESVESGIGPVCEGRV